VKTWFITGVSTGLGRALAHEVLATGDRVVGTLRDPAALAEFQGAANATGVLLDVRDDAGVRATIDALERDGTAIDVLVNNAGYGLLGTVEETPLAHARALFDVNVFGALSVTQAMLPYMRARRRGHIVTISSIGGLTAFPSLGLYNGSKFALEGIYEALAAEVAPLGLRVTLVEPGAFRTDWTGRSMVHAPSSIADYASTAGAFREEVAQRDGAQPGDPIKAADAIIAAVADETPPLHLVLGQDALAAIDRKLAALGADVHRWRERSAATGFE
jgi:NAD(P)-dependent dehydrogenase (short-subunit alcohol dehydrogenase family)